MTATVQKVGLVFLTVIAAAVAVAFFFLVIRQGFPKVLTPEFMNARVFITCNPAELAKYSQLVTVISSEEKHYIEEIKKHLNPSQIVQPESVIDTSIAKRKGEDALLDHDTRRPELWIAFSVDVKPQTPTTEIEIPTVFDLPHTTRLMALAKTPYITKNNAEINTLGSAVAPARDVDVIAQLIFVPESPTNLVQNASLELSFFGNVCGKRDVVSAR
jgi:hypothetical protein